MSNECTGVYCKDCRYYLKITGAAYVLSWEGCIAPTGKIIKDYIKGDYPETVSKKVTNSNYPNNRQTNGCKLYKRKWWKFWIKEPKVLPQRGETWMLKGKNTTVHIKSSAKEQVKYTFSKWGVTWDLDTESFLQIYKKVEKDDWL